MPLFPEISDFVRSEIAPRLRSIRDGLSNDLISLELKDGFNGSWSTGDYFQPTAGFHRLAGAYGGNATDAGVNVTVDSAFQLTAFFAGVKLIAEDMGMMPFVTYKRNANRKSQEVAYDLPLYRTLRNLVNPDVSSGEFVEAMTAQALVTGAGYAEIQRQGSSTIYLWPWQIGETRTDKDSKGRIVYLHREGGAPEKTYSSDRVFQLRGFTITGTDGENLIHRGRQALGLGSAMQSYAGKYFSRDATPGVVIQFPKEATPIQPDGLKKIKEEWGKWHRGQPFEPAILQEGATANKLGTGAAESQLNEQRVFQLQEVCRLLRLSPHKLADLTRATFSNIEQLAIEHVTNTMGPWIERWKRGVHRCLLTVDEQLADRIYAEHDVAILLRGDFATQAEGFRKLLEKGVYCINDVRRWLRMNPIPGGDEHFIQMNLAPVQMVAAGETIAKLQQASAQSGSNPQLKSLLNQIIGEMQARESEADTKSASIISLSQLQPQRAAI